jgi:hypothetical protein
VRRRRARIVRFELDGVVVDEPGADGVLITFDEVLTAERSRSARGLELHTQASMEPTRIRCGRGERWAVEDRLRANGVRIVDCWGAIIAPTLADFEYELARTPVRLRQSSDNA